MASTLNRYKKDLETLVERGKALEAAIELESISAELHSRKIDKHKGELKKLADRLPSFNSEYQGWYSEAKVLIKQLLPDRLDDFVRHYEKPRSRKDITYENYRIEDCLQNLKVTNKVWKGDSFDESTVKVVGPEAAIPHFQQQLNILIAVKARFESSLFDIQQLVTADLFDSELDAASELAKKKFTREAGALAGVVLEKHLHKVCEVRSLTIRKKKPTISDFNEVLKRAHIVDVATWRFIQHLADLRNLCDHDRKSEPTNTQVDELISGVNKIIKTVF